MHTITNERTENKRVIFDVYCKEHDELFTIRKDHLKERGCAYCQHKRWSFKRFVEEANKVHNNKFEYVRDYWIDTHQKIGAICPVHGFIQISSGANHLRNRGCDKCRLENCCYTSKSKFKDFCNHHNKQGLFYIIRCWDDEGEEFYKLGITSRSIAQRYGSKTKISKNLPYYYEILLEEVGEPEDIYDKELQLKRKLNNYHYKPKKDFNGSVYECFTVNPLTLDEFS